MLTAGCLGGTFLLAAGCGDSEEMVQGGLGAACTSFPQCGSFQANVPTPSGRSQTYTRSWLRPAGQ